jgi:hypothetical protein
MRLVHLHIGSTAPGNGMPMEPETTGPIGIMAVASSANGDVAATFSVMGEVSVTGSTPEAILFGGASIMSLAGASPQQWSGRILDNAYERICLSLHGCSVMSFDARATEAAR